MWTRVRSVDLQQAGTVTVYDIAKDIQQDLSTMRARSHMQARSSDCLFDPDKFGFKDYDYSLSKHTLSEQERFTLPEVATKAREKFALDQLSWRQAEAERYARAEAERRPRYLKALGHAAGAAAMPVEPAPPADDEAAQSVLGLLGTVAVAPPGLGGFGGSGTGFKRRASADDLASYSIVGGGGVFGTADATEAGTSAAGEEGGHDGTLCLGFAARYLLGVISAPPP